MDEFAGMEIDAEQASAALAQSGICPFEVSFNFFDVRPVIVWPEVADILHAKNVQDPAVPERLAVQADLLTVVQIDMDSHFAHGWLSLRTPGTARLAIGSRHDPEDPSDVINSRLLAPDELRHAVLPVKRLFEFGRACAPTVVIRMVSNGVLVQRRNHVLAVAPLKRPCFHSNH